MKLVYFLMKLQNESVQVELKNGNLVQGTILSVSPNMNINLKDVKMTSIDNSISVLEHMTIRGSQVRMVLLPDELNLDSILTDPIFKPKRKSQPLNNQINTTNSSSSSSSNNNNTTKAPKRTSRAKNRGF